MDDIKELFEELTIPLSPSPVEGVELRGITFEAFQTVIERERTRAAMWATQDAQSRLLSTDSV